MGVRGIVNANGGGDVSALTTRVTTLENVQNEYEIYYSIASGTSGNATIPTGSSIVAAQYGTANGLVVQVDATGKPTDIAARTAAGAVVTVTLNTGTGAYTLSGAPSAYPVALVYQVLCSAKDAANIPVASIIDWTVAKGSMSTQNADAVAITGGSAAFTGTLTQSGTAVSLSGHTHTSSNITDFNSASRGQTEAALVAGSNITITPAGTGATRTLTIASSGGGGSSTELREASVVVTPAQYFDATVSVSDPLVSTSSKILANLVPSEDWDADDLADYSVTAKVDDGVIYFIINGPGPIVGTFNINYLWTGNPV